MALYQITSTKNSDVVLFAEAESAETALRKAAAKLQLNAEEFIAGGENMVPSLRVSVPRGEYSQLFADSVFESHELLARSVEVI